MSTMSAMALPELGGMHEFEFEAEGAAPVWRGAYALGEGEGETEAFFENLAEYAVGGGGGRGAGQAAGLGRIGTLAYRAAVGSTGGVPLATLGLNGDVGEYFDRESGLVRLSPLVVMEHFGHAMTEAESETEAEAFLPFLIPLAAKALPMLAKAVIPKLGSVVSKIAPRLMQGATRVLRTLRRNPRTRPLVRVMPTIVRRTMAGVARDVQQGQPVTPQQAVRRLGANSRQVLSSPNACVEAYRRSRALDRRYHLICHRAPCW